MKDLGTILPTRETLAANERYAAELARKKATVAARELQGCERRTVGGEVRYYRGATTYAIVGKRLNVMWFETREDGDYRI